MQTIWNSHASSVLFSFILKGKKKQGSTWDLFHAKLLLKRTDLTKWSAVLWKSLPVLAFQPSSHYSSKDRHDPHECEIPRWSGWPRSVSPQAYESSWEACPFSPHPADLRWCLTLCCWGTQSLSLDSHWQKIRWYFNKVTICLYCNVCISVGPGRHSYVPLLSK